MKKTKIPKSKRPYNKKHNPHGLWKVYDYINPRIFDKGYYINGIRYGYWIENWYSQKAQAILFIK